MLELCDIDVYVFPYLFAVVVVPAYMFVWFNSDCWSDSYSYVWLLKVLSVNDFFSEVLPVSGTTISYICTDLLICLWSTWS